MPGPSVGHDRAGVQRYILEDFTGGLHSEGVWSKIALADNECSCAQNVEFWPPGTVSKRKGRVCKNPTMQLSGAVSHIHQWWSATGASHIMVFTASSGTEATEVSAQIMDFTPDTLPANSFTYILSSGQTSWNHSIDDGISSTTLVGSAFFCNGIDYLMTWNGTDTCAPVTAAPKGAKAVCSYMNYLFVANIEDIGGGTRHASRIQWSDPSDPHSWPESQWLDLNPEDGDKITGMAILGNELIVFKEFRVYAVAYVGGTFQFTAEVRIEGKGCAAGTSLFPKYNYIGFYGADGFYRFDGTNAQRISDRVKDFILLFTPTVRDRIYTTALEDHAQIWALVPLKSASTFNTILVYDYDRDNWTVYETDASTMTGYLRTEDVTFESFDEPYQDVDVAWGDISLQGNVNTIITGSYDGYLFYHNIGDIDEGTAGASAAIDAKWISKWIDFGQSDINKRVTRLTIYADNEATVAAEAYYLNVKLYKDWDSDTAIYETTIPLSGSSGGVLEKRIDTTFACRSMAVEFGTNTADGFFRVHKVVIEYIPKGRTLVT